MSEARTILVAGTASHVGKSTVAAGLCRLLADRGVDVAPFKAQNMSNNARAVADPDGATGEIGVSQYVQARAARVPATTDHNPVLLKPRGDGESQLILQGEAVAHYSAGEYYDDHWDGALAAARESHARLAADHDVIVAEGAGSIAEPNLRDRDLANVETARFASADILLVADIERGGVFASLVGTIELIPADLREQVVGAVITKFRGDRSLLDPGIAELEERTGVPILGVLPYDDPGLPEEDSVSLPPVGERAVRGDEDGISDDQSVIVGVPRLPRASNMTDLEPLAREPGVRVAYLPLDAALADVDAVVLPGTKNTVDDLRALREADFGAELAAFDGPVVGLCGGYQLLGERITNAGVESTDDLDSLAGFGLLPVETRFEADKQVEPVTREVRGVGPLSGATGTVRGYEIHMGKTRLIGEAERPFPGDEGREPDGAATERVLGTYLHGLFENPTARTVFVESVFAAADRDRPSGGESATGTAGTAPGGIDAAADRAAALLRDYVDLDLLALPGPGHGDGP
ncbi:cobyric acid synthase [Halorientalis regularis]|uniref:Probable cobyric acid synthase n=1 Tax=Halorientalis regularis TaxID=660518 RepID=A0A1G7TLM3_9EURY|nr:cobyric acid synthase [Halorientalis regularis]SDG36227.1 adenosylcobyric acid synthase (glutamine-hydrolysing) [Halorientalis regularis]